MSNNKDFPELGGYVTSARDFIGKSNRIDPYGIFSECIFGPEQDYKCTCGNLTHKSIDGGKVCPKCGVYCGSSDLRYSTFGKIRLVFPIVKPNKFTQFFRLIHKDFMDMVKDPTKNDSLMSTTQYVSVSNDLTKIKQVTNLNIENDYTPIPLRITGNYSLYLVLKFCLDYLGMSWIQEIFDNGYMTDELLVIPPSLRPAIHDPTKKEVRTPKINSFYISILRLNNSKRPLLANLPYDEENWIGLVKTQISNQIFNQEIVDATIMEYDSIATRYQYYVNLIYETVYSELSGKSGLIRSSILGRNIEFSARTVIRSDPSLPPYQLRVSKKILKKIWAPYFMHYLCIEKGLDFDYCFEQYMLPEEESDDYNNMFDEFLEWLYE